MPRYARVSDSKFNRLRYVLKAIIRLKTNPSLSNMLHATVLAKNLLEDLSAGKIWEQSTERLMKLQGLYYVVIKEEGGRKFFADEKMRLPIYKNLRDLAIAVKENGWTEEKNYYIHRIDLIRILDKSWENSITAKYGKEDKDI